jgi:hypothetical protein
MAQPPAEEDPAPVPPVAPTMRDCCRGGCEPCVFQVYEEELATYEIRLKEWNKRRGDELRQ